MAKKVKIDLSDIKEDDLDKTASFTDLMTRKERRERYQRTDDIEEMVSEKRKNTKDLTNDVKKAKEEVKKENLKEKELEMTRQIKYNIKENIKSENKKSGPTPLTDIGIFIIFALAYFIYNLLTTETISNPLYLLINCGTIFLMFLLFCIAFLTTTKNNKLIKFIIFLILLAYVAFNVLIYIKVI